MKNDELQFDRKIHVLYSKTCEEEIKKKISLHYEPSQTEEVWTKVQLQYVNFLSDYRTDLGGKKNFHNGKGGTYDCIALISYYVVCKEVSSVKEIEEMEENLFLPSFKKLKFVDGNKLIYKKLLHKSFCIAQKKCSKWNDYEMILEPFSKEKPIHYIFKSCPVAEFAKKHNLLEIMPAMCNPDYKAMELIHAKLVRPVTIACGDICDYYICGDKDRYVDEHPEYIDELGFKRNK